MSRHRARDCACDACAALGGVASVVVDEEAKVLERSYTKILEKGLQLLRRERKAEEEATSGVESDATPGQASAAPPAEAEDATKVVKKEPEEEATKRKKRRKKKPQPEEEIAIEVDQLPQEKKAAETKERSPN